MARPPIDPEDGRHLPRREFGRVNLYTKALEVTVEDVARVARRTLLAMKTKSKAVVCEAVAAAMLALEVDPEAHYPLEVDRLRTKTCLKLYDELMAPMNRAIPSDYHFDTEHDVRCQKWKKE
jgi:hypothetical protein